MLSSTIADPREYLQTPAAESTGSPDSIVLSLSTAPTDSTGIADCPLDLLVALAAKGFAILTGPSGTGKSRVALRLAYSLERTSGASPSSPGASIAFVPVGADWTDLRPVLGSRNPFGKARQTSEGETTNETYQITAALRVILRAADPQRAMMPHFLVLDEMNLSHVERYFSAFLSLMEARRSAQGEASIPILLPEAVSLISEVLQVEDSESLEAIAAAQLDQAGRGLLLPHNLFVVGTVNVDETTYMFSPKVLDRAHVIELLPLSPAVYIDNQTTDASLMVSSDVALAVLTAAMRLHRSGQIDARHPVALLDSAAHELGVPTAICTSISTTLRQLLQGAFKLLEPVGFSFGYRTINEVYDYMYFWLLAQRVHGGEGAEYLQWPAAIDRAFIQKVLPKLHGNRRQLGNSLSALLAFLAGNDANGSPPARYRQGEATEVRVESSEVLDAIAASNMTSSRAKLSRMAEQLAAVGYVSFVQ